MNSRIVLVPLINREVDFYFPPLGVLYLARSILNLEEGWNVEVIEQTAPDGQFYPSDFWNTDEIVTRIMRKDCDVVGISSFTFTLPLAIRIAEDLKRKDPHKKIVLGGAGPSGVGEKILRAFPHIDYVVDGEGERTFTQLMNVLDGNGPLETIKGVFYRENGKICYNGPQLRVENLDDLGFPAYELVDMNTYKKVGIIWHRGCPYNCAFCDVSQMWGRKVTSRSIDCVIEEIEMLSTTYKIKSIQFFDDTFTLRKDHTVEMCKNLKKLDVSWAANGRVNMVSKNLLKTMEDAGCRGVLYGIESGSNRVLKEINKKFTVEDVIDVIGKTPESILVKVSFIWNYPFETLTDFYKTFLFISYLLSNRIHARYSPLSLFAQSQLYRQYKDNLIIDREKSIHWNTLLSQNLVNEGGLTLPSWVRDLVFENPDIFPGLLWVKSPNMEEKIQFVRKYMQIMGQL